MNALDWTIQNKIPLPLGRIILCGDDYWRVESHNKGLYRLKLVSGIRPGQVVSVTPDHKIFVEGDV